MTTTRKRPKQFRRTLHPMWKKLRKATRKYHSLTLDGEPYLGEPLCLTQRAVLRAQVEIPIRTIIELHRLYQHHQKKGNNILAAIGITAQLDGMPDDDDEDVMSRCVIRVLLEERLKSKSQLLGIVQCDPNLTKRSQELFEQVFQAEGMPNDAEKEFLATVARTGTGEVDEWFTATQHRLRILGPSLVTHWAMEKLRLRETEKRKKVPTRH